jgi:hypothetical protein
MKFMTVEQILFIHLCPISETGGTQGICDLGRLE